MIHAKFLFGKSYKGFIVSGHAGGIYGRDVICAGTSSAVMLTINIIAEYFTENKSDIKIKINENAAGILLIKPNESASRLIEALRLHLEAIDLKKSSIKISVVYV